MSVRFTKSKYTAEQIAEMLGVSPATIDTWADELGIKHNPRLAYRDPAGGRWHYYIGAVKLLKLNASYCFEED